MRKDRPAGMAFIFITLVIDVIGFGLVIPVLPGLVLKLAGGTPAHGAGIYGWLLSIYGLMQFVCAPILGNLSDKYGRRPVLLLSLLFTGGDYMIQALAPTIGWLFLGRILAGIMGASFTAATAYIADVSPPEKRAQNFGMVGAAFGLGFIIGPAIGGLLGSFGERVPFWFAAGFALLNVLYGFFVLPESLDKEHRREFDYQSLNPFKSLGVLGRDRLILTIAGIATLLWMAQQVPPSTWVLFTTEKLHWGKKENGLSLGLIGACSMAVQMGLIRILSPRLGDYGLLLFGLVFNFIGFLLLGSSMTGAWMLGSMTIWSLCFVGGPAIQSLVSRQFGPTEQGASQGALTAIQSLSGVVGPPIFSLVFAHFTSPGQPYVPGAAFYLGAILTVFAGGLYWVMSRLRSRVPAEV